MLKTGGLILVGTIYLASPFGYAQTHIVKMMSNELGVPMFEPNHLLIQPGDTVVWRNVDTNIEHNVVAEPTAVPRGAELFESPLIDELGKEWSHRFNQVGTYNYHCHPHAAKGMTGTIVVGRESLQGEYRTDAGSGQYHHSDKHEH